MTTTRDSARYGRISDRRLGPAPELYARADLDATRIVHDVGCGRSEIARVAADRRPHARVAGSDTSPAIPADAAATPGRVERTQLDVAERAPDEPHDLIAGYRTSLRTA